MAGTAIPGSPHQRWAFEIGGVALVVTRIRAERWEVVYGGFSRVVAERLGDAVAVAAGANPMEPWIIEITRSVREGAAIVDNAPRSRPHAEGFPKTAGPSRRRNRAATAQFVQRAQTRTDE